MVNLVSHLVPRVKSEVRQKIDQETKLRESRSHLEEVKDLLKFTFTCLHTWRNIQDRLGFVSLKRMICKPSKEGLLCLSSTPRLSCFYTIFCLWFSSSFSRHTFLLCGDTLTSSVQNKILMSPVMAPLLSSLLTQHPPRFLKLGQKFQSDLTKSRIWLDSSLKHVISSTQIALGNQN